MIARDAQRRGDAAGIAVEAAIWRSFNSPTHDLRRQAAQITAPVLLAWGIKDPMLGWTGRIARRCIPQAAWHPLPTGHAPFAEAPRAFLAAATPFLTAACGCDAAPHPPSS